MSDWEHPPLAAIPHQALLAAIVASSHDAIISKTLDGVIASWNRGAQRIFGYEPQEAIGQSILMLIPPELHAEEASILQCLRRGEAVHDLETVRLRKDGERIAVSLTSSPVRDERGRIVGASKVVRDVSAAKQAERELAQSRARLAGIVESAMDAIITVDERGSIVVFNDAASKMFGCDAAQARGQLLERFIPPRFRAEHAQRMRRFGAGAPTARSMGFPGEIWALRSDGREFPVEASISHVQIDGHALFTVIMRDLSELRQAREDRRTLENQLREAQKMEAIGTLAGGIAHDFNNIIAAILGNVGLARTEIDAAHAALPYLEQIGSAASRARSVVRQVLAFSRRQPQQFMIQPLRPIIQEALTLMRVTLPSIVRLEASLADTELHVRADSTQLQQVVLNLCTNAWHALQGSTGRIEIGLDEVALGAGTALRAGELAPGSYAHVWVRDNGCGMDEVTRSRIFEPFYTTKPRGEGTGLGLSVVHGIVVDHHGAIVVDTAVGLGSTFHLYLPATSAPHEAATLAPAAAAQATTADGERIVYVDDDDVMTLMVERLLTRRGYAIVCYRDAHAAISAIRSNPRCCDCVVADYNMPDLSGLDVARELALIAPALPVIITSGYISDELRSGAVRFGVRALMEKESTFEELPGLISRVLSEAT